NVADAITLLANEAAIQATGLSKEDYLGKTAKETDPSVFESPLYRMVLETLRTGLPFQTQYHIQPTDRWLELSVSKIDEDHMVNVFTDVTATKKAQLDLEKAVTQLSLVFNTAQAGLFTLRPVENEAGHIIDFRFGLVNQSVASYIGEKAETLGGALASIYFPAYRENGLFDIYKDTMLSGNPHQFDFHYEDGYDVFFNIHTVKSGDEVLVTFTDHTVLKRLQRELETTIEELKRSNANLEEFAYAASHDLKEPIRKIHFFSDRLKERLKSRLDEEEQRLFGRMQTATERMRSLVDDLLLYSQVGVRPRSFEEVDLSYLIELIAGDLELEIEEKKAVLKWEGLPTVNGHMRQLQQLFHNLLGNALKYTRPGIAPEIFLSCSLITGRESGIHLPADELGRHFYQIKVKDNGIGFEQKDAEKIFHVFQRLHGNSEYRGTGVGLSIARKVAENHHGYISAQSEPGKGSIFQVLLPRQV
ncbi:MAG TPA: ATP-binding protein, partial [Flavisolibacter sp.]|nr:ATP-binding protein [Flavisolibacter sp.]